MKLTRIAVLFALVAFFSVTAPAYDLSSFRLRIEDPATGVGRVIYNGQSLGFGNNAGDQNLTPGTIYFAGFLENFNVAIQATSSPVNPDGTGGVLTLSARITYSQAAIPASIMITIEDDGYIAPATPVVFTGTVGGYDYAAKAVTPTGTLTGAVQSVTLQSWLDRNNIEPPFGAYTGSTVLNPLTQTIPPVGSNTVTAFSAPQTFGTTGFSYAGAGVPVTFTGANYSMFSQATVNFSGIGTADFTLTASDPAAPTGGGGTGTSVPEPTSLMLLGSTLLGLGIVRRKK